MAALEFDHPHGRDWTPAKKNRWQRMVLYERDAAAGNLRLLCRSCNATDGNHRRWRRRGTRGGLAAPLLGLGFLNLDHAL